MFEDVCSQPVFPKRTGSPALTPDRLELPAIIYRKLRALERALRTYVAADGLVTTLFALGSLFWFDLAIDRFFQPSWGVRLFLLLMMLAAFVAILRARIFRRLFAQLRDDQLAMVFERQVPRLNETLLTTVDLHDRIGEVHPVFWESTVREAAETIAQVNVHAMFKYRRLVARSLLAVLMLGAIAGFCFSFPETAGTWFSRNLLLSSREWPRISRIHVEGFGDDGRVRVARGDSFTMLVRAATSAALVPETVKILTGTRQAGFRTLVLDQFRLDQLDGTEYRTFAGTFTELLEPLDISVQAGDTRLDGFHIEVVPPPVLSDIRIIVGYPEYMRRPPAPPVRPTGRTIVPEGSGVSIEATVNKPLRKLGVSRDGGDPILVFEEHSSDARDRFEFELADLRDDTFLEFFLGDGDGLRNRHPIRLDFAVLKDNPPVVTARLVGIGSAVTPAAVLPIEGELTDDYGIDRVFYAYSVVRGHAATNADSKSATPESPGETGDVPTTDVPAAGAAPTHDTPKDAPKNTADFSGTRPIAEQVDRTTFPLNREFDVQELNLNPGDRLTLDIEAFDCYRLPGMETTGRQGVGDRWSLDVVSPEQLKTMLEVREITLRQRFEILIDEVKRTRILAEEFALDGQPAEPDDVKPENVNSEDVWPEERGENDVHEGGESEGQEEQERSVETAGERSELERQLAEQRRRERERISKAHAEAGIYNITRVLRDTQKETYEIGTISQAFLDIRREMFNNRILTPEIRQRIDDGIIEPIRSLLEKEFVDLDERLVVLNRLLEERETTIRSTTLRQRTDVLAQFDRILERMGAIRDNMLSMESYAEAIELLRVIIRQQEQLREETRQEKKDQLRNLLDP